MGEVALTWEDKSQMALPFELSILNVFKELYPLSEKIDNWTCDIDTHDPECGKIEIKTEEVAARSKRFWVEVSKTTWNGSGQRIETPSGLCHTETKWWIQTDTSGEMFFMKTAALQQFIEENKSTLEYLKDIKSNQGGYDTYNNCYVVYYKQFETFSRWHGHIDEFTPKLLKFILEF